jgi:predicted transcriptional regulator
MSTSFTVRLDDHAERALDELTRDGSSPNVVIRRVLALAHRARADDRMRRESAELLEDPHDLAELGAARKAMGVGDAR